MMRLEKSAFRFWDESVTMAVFCDCISDFQGLLASGNVLIGNCEENRTKGANGCTR